MERLKTLDLSGCYRVENLSENLQQAKLRPNLSSLFKVIVGRRKNPMPRMLPSLLGLSSLRELKLRDCNLCEGDIPRDISGLSSLRRLDLSGNNFISIPASLTRLSKLSSLDLSNCNMGTLGEAEIHGLSSLKCLRLCGNNFITIRLALTQLSRLESLVLSNCMKLKLLSELPISLACVIIDGCSSLEVVTSLSKICNSVIAINCFKLAANINAITLLKKYLKAFGNSRKCFK
ncbi:uncharacterized protein LOC128036580 [Gossypium raimondii]|uniref:uncharacterized protein LOC128036580 n=1 Tax=Gossypium raimondii TaxID=29730 RepID=UPI00227A2C4E|nr:uncharacterized protein LOC128036580 [Gossypium raimondii]